MLASLINVNITLLGIIWGISISFLSVSVLLCIGILIRRLVRNKNAQKRGFQKETFNKFLRKTITDESDSECLLDVPDCEVSDMTEIFLHYFRTLKGEQCKRLVDMISYTPIETKIMEATYSGLRGNRMAAVRTLSYLQSFKSIQVIFGNLYSEEKYVRLTAAKCLVRRNGLPYLPVIIHAIIEAFPTDPKLLASILAKFGREAIQPLEDQIRSSTNAVVITSCLEALILIMPPSTSLNLGKLMESADPAVRAAALSLSCLSKHTDKSDPLRKGLQDETTLVKMRAVKMANDLKRVDLTPELYKLSTDPLMWVRYWALRAIWGGGTSGEKFVHSLAKTNTMAENVAIEISSGYA